mgnify:CR=1 FL=1
MSSKNSERKRLFLIDGYAMLYRAHFAMISNPLINSKGQHTSALFGFLNQIFRLLKKEEPDYLVAAFDAKEKTFRHEKYPEYKATREKMPDEMRTQLDYLWDVLEALNIPRLVEPGFEADDIIGTLAKRGEEAGLDVYIVSGDKDFMQLITKNVFLYAPSGRRGEIKIYDPKGVEEKWGIPPEKMIDMLGLMGDSSDNVPGVSGVGEKSAKKLLDEYGSLEAALENAENVSNKRVRNGLLEGKENAILSKELVTIETNMDIPADLDTFERNQPNGDAVKELFAELEFHSLINLVQGIEEAAAPSAEESNKSYKTILTNDDLKAMIKELESAQLISVDLETTSVIPMQAEIIGISFSVSADAGWYIPIAYKDKNKSNFGKDDLKAVLKAVAPVLENESIPKTGQHIKYDALIFRNNGVDVKGIVFDTMIAAHLIKPELRSYKLDNLSLEYLNYRMMPIEELIGTGRNQISMSEVELEKAAYYASEDADIAFQLTEMFQEKLKEVNLKDFFESVELPLIPVLTQMEYDGLFVDGKHLNGMSKEMGKKIDALVSDIQKEAGTEFNVNSTQQLAQILFDMLELRQVQKRSTAENVLEQLKDEHPLPRLVLEYRKLNKLRSTYIDALPELIHEKTGRIHSTFSQTVAATGRLSSRDPNFQNIPIRTEEGREIRKAFRAQKKGWMIVSCDYSQIELRILAHLSKDPALMDGFQKGEDIHSRTASDIFGVELKDVLPEMRRTAKIVNFGLIYGAGPYRMSQELGVPRKEAQAIIEAYFAQYSGIKNYIESTVNNARENKYVETMLGRRRHVWDIDSSNHMHKEAAKRMAINMPIQGTNAEMIKLAMIAIYKKLAEESMNSKMVLQIHDELLFEAPKAEVDDLIGMVTEEMVKALPLDIPIVVDSGVGESWFEAH